MSRFRLNWLSSFHLPILQLDRSRPAENTDRDTQLSTIRVDLFHDAALVLERTVRYFDRFAYLEADLGFDLVFKLPDLRQHAFHLLRSHRNRLILCARKAEYPRCFANKIPGP